MQDPTHPSTPPERYAEASYAEAVAHAADRLDDTLADIRRAQAAGEMTVREAADNRVAVLEAHLAELRRLSAEHYGTER